MRVYVIRHAAAADASEYERDRDRPLTRAGIRTMTAVAKALAAAGMAPEAIFTSPFVRAVETAEIVARAVGAGKAVERKELAGGHGASEVLEFLARQSAAEAAVVGHEPQLGELVSLMVLGSDKPVVDMKKASVACVVFDGAPAAGEGVLAWHVVPAVLGAAGK